MSNSTILRKNCKRFWSCESPPWTAKDKYGWLFLSAIVGVRVALGRFPGSNTLYGPSFGSNTKLCILWLNPIPVFPAITAGIHPPLGVIDTIQPEESAAWTVVVPAINDSSKL